MGCVSVAHMVVAHVRMARSWAARAGGAGVSVIAIGSARGCALGGTRMHASGRGMGLEVRVPLGLSFGLVRRAEWLPLRRVVVLVSAVRRVWLRKVFSVRTSGTYVVLSCHRFLFIHCVTLFVVLSIKKRLIHPT